MNATVFSDGLRLDTLAERALNASGRLWFAVAMIGQWAFFYYIVAFYGSTTFTGNFEAWSVLRKLGGTGYVAGDLAGNLTFAAHALAAGIIAFGGALQLIPQIRTYAPRFHHWNGRVFLATVVGLSLSGFYLVWVRGTSPSLVSALTTSLNGVLILAFAYLAYRYARAREIATHRRWALRLYLVSNAQWFLRIGMFAYFIINMGLGRKVKMASDPFLAFWMVGCYLVPLAVVELYLRAKDSRNASAQFAVAGGLLMITLAMAVGVFGFAMFSQRILSGAPLSL